MSFIEFHELTCRFGRLVALDRVSFAVGEAEWVTIMGPTASGKTTLLRALAGLERPASGEVRLKGEAASNGRVVIPPHERGVALLFQGPSLWPHLSVRANVGLGVPDSVSRVDRKRIVNEWLERLKLAPLASKFPSELSGGEARGVSIARAMASRPRILLLDEPAAHLDLHLGESTMRQVRELCRELQITTLCVTHQVQPPMTTSDRLIVLESGRLVFDGAMDGLVEAPGSPFVKALERAVRLLELSDEKS